jgi:heme o synthase
VKARVSAYIELMKLRVVELLLITTVPSLFLAAKGWPSLKVTLASLIGGTLAAGASNAFNMIIERDSDKLMSRTRKRPIARGAISESESFIFASALTVISLVVFRVFTNILAMVLTAAAITIYVLIYSIILKRRTSQNIVWGGIAGCMPVLIGFAAIDNRIPAPAWCFFLLIFFWTPPHFWALAIKYKDDYSAANIPMLPSVAPISNVLSQMWGHTICMIIFSYATLITAHLAWWSYLVTTLLALYFLYQMVKITRSKLDKDALRLFHGSITYLTVYSLLLVIGALAK